MKTRLMTAAVILAIYVPSFIIGGIVIDIVLGISAMIATWEFSRMFNKEKNTLSVLIIQIFF